MTDPTTHQNRRPSSLVRIGDRERAEAASRLSAHAAAGRLTMPELEERLERVELAVFAGDVLAVESDLPAPARREARQRPPSAALACLLAAALVSVLVGHPLVPLFIVAALLWRGSRRSSGNRLSLERTLP